MAKPTYEQLEKRVQELEKLLGGLIDEALDSEEHELFELSVLLNISEAVASTRDLDSLLPVVIGEVNKALLTEGAGVLLYDENRGDLYWREVRDARDILSSQRSELRLPLDASIAGWVFQNNKTARVNDTSKDPRYYPGMTAKSGFDIKRVLQAPLVTREKTIGVLMTMNKIGGDFNELDERLITSMAGSIAMAIENATVYEKLKKSRDDLEMLYQSTMALAKTMDLDHLLEVVLAEFNSAMDTEAAGVLLYDQQMNNLYWKAALDESGIVARKASLLRLPLDRSVAGQVFQSGEPVMLNDPKSHPNFYADFETITGTEIRNEVLVPLNTREETLGVLICLNRKHGQFIEEDLNVCSSLAGVVAIAVENAMFFQELIDSYRELEDINRVKSKILNHLSHELRTPLAIVRGTISTMKKRMQSQGVTGYERALSRIERHLQSLNRLESQVESIMMTGYTWERRMISDFLAKALTLMEIQAEWTPAIKEAAEVIHKWLVKTFPIRQDEPELIDFRSFGESVFQYCRTTALDAGRNLSMELDLENGAKVLIPGHVLRAIMEGLIRNAVEATPDNGQVTVTGRKAGNRYQFTVKDTGIGIPEDDMKYIFQGFYPVQATENYSSGRQYCFNAGGKGIDLLRIRMFSELYGFKLSFRTQTCRYLDSSRENMPGDAALCEHCSTPEDCMNTGGSEFVVDFALADPKTAVSASTHTEKCA